MGILDTYRALSWDGKALARKVYDHLRHYHDEGYEGYEPRYCKHGGYVGHPYGPDYMCGTCENGVEDLDYALYAARDYDDRYLRELKRKLMDHLLDIAEPNKCSGSLIELVRALH